MQYCHVSTHRGCVTHICVSELLFVQLMAGCLLGNKQLSELMLNYCLLILRKEVLIAQNVFTNVVCILPVILFRPKSVDQTRKRKTTICPMLFQSHTNGKAQSTWYGRILGSAKLNRAVASHRERGAIYRIYRMNHLVNQNIFRIYVDEYHP